MVGNVGVTHPTTGMVVDDESVGPHTIGAGVVVDVVVVAPLAAETANTNGSTATAAMHSPGMSGRRISDTLVIDRGSQMSASTRYLSHGLRSATQTRRKAHGRMVRRRGIVRRGSTGRLGVLRLNHDEHLGWPVRRNSDSTGPTVRSTQELQLPRMRAGHPARSRTHRGGSAGCTGPAAPLAPRVLGQATARLVRTRPRGSRARCRALARHRIECADRSHQGRARTRNRCVARDVASPR